MAEFRVEWRSGVDGAEPWRLWFGRRPVEVREVLDRWFGSDHGYFKVRGDDGATYIVRHDEETGEWQLTMFDAGVLDEWR